MDCDSVIDSGSEMLNPLCPCDFVECLDCAVVDGGGKCFKSLS